jgi:restriction endonuclease S subunit
MKDISSVGELSLDRATCVQVPDSASHALKSGDLILKARGNVNSAAVVSEIQGEAIAAAPLVVIRLRSEAVRPEYLQWFLNHPTTQARLTAAATGSYIPTVGKQALEELEIDLPPLEQQALIVRIASLATEEQALLARIASKRKDAMEQILVRLKESSREVREVGGRRGAATPRLPGHKQ